MKRTFRNDFKRIGRAGRVARYAERIGKAETGNLAVILTAAYLIDIDAAAEGPRGDDPAAPPVPGELAGARAILVKLGAREDLIAEVADIITRHRSGRIGDSVNFRAVFDAAALERLEAEHKQDPIAAGELAERIERSFLTAAGRQAARETLLPAR